MNNSKKLNMALFSNIVDVPMINNETYQQDFVVTVFGARVGDLLTIPNYVIRTLAQRYPNHTTSPFILEQARKQRLQP